MSELVHLGRYVEDIELPLSDEAQVFEQILNQEKGGFLVVARETYLESAGLASRNLVATTNYFLAPISPDFNGEQLFQKQRLCGEIFHRLGLRTFEKGSFMGGVSDRREIIPLQLYTVTADREIGWRERVIPPYEYHVFDTRILELLREEAARNESSLRQSRKQREEILMRLSFHFFPDERLAQLTHQYLAGRNKGTVKINPVLQQILGENNLGIGVIPLEIVKAAYLGEANPYPELEEVDRFAEEKTKLQGLPAYQRLRAKFERLNLRDGLPRTALTFGDIIDMMLLAYGSTDRNLSGVLLNEIGIIKYHFSGRLSPNVKGLLTAGFNMLFRNSSKELSARHHTWLNVPVDLGYLIANLQKEDSGSLGITSPAGYMLTIAKKQGSEDLYEIVFPDLDKQTQYVAAIFREVGLPVRQETS